VVRNASIVGAGTLLSRIAGLVRDQVTAFYFGASPAADAFFVAFRIPNLLRRLLAEGALTPAFVPVFTDRLVSGGKEAARGLFVGVWSLMTLVLGAITVLGVVFAPTIVRLIAPGFASNPGQFELTVLLARVLFPYILLITLTALAMGALNSLGRFNIPALGPVLLNVCMVLGAVLISPRLERPILGLALGALLGGVAQLAIQLPGIVRAGISLGFTLKLKDPAVFRVLKLMAPTALGAAAYQVSVFVNTQLASLLEEGSVSFLYYADRLVQFPLGVFSLAIATAILPAMARSKAEGDELGFKEMFQRALSLQFFITIPAMAGLMVMGVPLVSLLFERGSFDAASTVETSKALLGYSLGLPFLSGASLAARAFYSLSDTKTPAKVAAVSLAIGLLLAIILMFPLGHAGLALASSLASLVNFLWLALLLRKKGILRLGDFASDALRSALYALLMAAILWPIYHSSLDAKSPLLIVAGLMLGPLVFFGAARLNNSANLAPVTDVLGKIKGRLLGGKAKTQEASGQKAKDMAAKDTEAGDIAAKDTEAKDTGAANIEPDDTESAARAGKDKDKGA
jgi:putative peptidoglycan lipid II flippase